MNPHIREVIAPLRRPLLAALLLACIAASGASRTVASDPVAAVAATTYYVSPTGDNASSGSVKAPWRTLTYAAGRLSPGDVLYLRGGLHREKVKFRSSMRGRGSTVGDPRLARTGSIAPGELTASYFKIGSRSPTIDAGADQAEVTGDYFGRSRPLGGAPDMGGYEYAPP